MPAQPKSNTAASEKEISGEAANLTIQDLVAMGLLKEEGETIIQVPSTPKSSGNDFRVPDELIQMLTGGDRNTDAPSFNIPKPPQRSNQGVNPQGLLGLGNRDFRG